MDIRIKRGQILKDLREKKHLRQSDLATILDVTQQAYQRYEGGTSEPNGETICKLADFYGVTTDYLLGREGAANPIYQLSSDTLEREVMTEYFKLPKEIRMTILESMKTAALNTAAAEQAEASGDIETFTCGELEDRAAEREKGGKFA